MGLLAEWHHSPEDYRLTRQGEPVPAVPQELREFWQFQRYGLPPNAGGLRDQPLGWLTNAETLARCYRAWGAWLSGNKGVKWRKEHADIWDTVEAMREVMDDK